MKIHNVWTLEFEPKGMLQRRGGEGYNLFNCQLILWKYLNNEQYDDLGQLVKDPRALAAVLAEMDEVGKEAQVCSS